MRVPFQLVKWYADCVSDDGDVFIGYAAELRWRALRLHYASVLECGRNQEARSRFSLLENPAPEEQGDTVGWRVPALGISGAWRALAPSLRQVLLSTAAGTVEWHCLRPCARADVRTRAKRLCGFGYLERLNLTLPPWRLPIRELRWGRFLSDSDSLVWIDWRGSHAVQSVFHNGAAVAAGRVEDDGLSLANGAVLSYQESFPLRAGALGDTVLAALPRVRSLLPARILQLRESKWCSLATLRIPPDREIRGWAIHECVEWP
jgi:hypothetical protein